MKAAFIRYRLQNRFQRGSAAVEAALVLPILVLFLSFPVFYARCCWHYTVAQKAAQDAARYLSSVSMTEMQSNALKSEAANRAIAIATKEISELSPGSEINPPRAYCDDVVCGENTPGVAPTRVKVFIAFSMYDTFAGEIYGWFGIPITADATMNYVGI